jgi:uncharacterized membrane protein
MFHSTLGLIHTALAVVAMCLGGWVLLRPKGDQLHRRIGYAYALAMLLVNATALSLYQLTGRFGPFHGFALLSLFSLAMGISSAYYKGGSGWFHRHYTYMGWSVVGLYAAFWSEVGARVLPMRQFWMGVVGATLLTVLVGAILIERNRARFTAQFGGKISAT